MHKVPDQPAFGKDMQKVEAKISLSIQAYLHWVVPDQSAFDKNMQTAEAQRSLNIQAYLQKEVPDKPAFGKDMQTAEAQIIQIIQSNHMWTGKFQISRPLANICRQPRPKSAGISGQEVPDHPAFSKDMQTAEAQVSLSNQAYVDREVQDQPAFDKYMQTTEVR